MAWRDYQNHPDPINFAVELIAKDETYALRTIDSSQTPLIASTLAAYQTAIAEGRGDEDWTVVTK
jgi:3-hydroxyisobutyrate dehydrogenase-like beta-hydroxyacid dehydrogenase